MENKMDKRILQAFPNTKVASTKAQLEFLEAIPAEQLKQVTLLTIEKYGLTFAEQEFIHLITNRWYEDNNE